MKKLCALWVMTLVFSSVCGATIWAEVGDAGPLPGTAQATVGVGPLLTITGAIGSGIDADMYLIYVTGGTVFSASTVGTPGTLADTQLFLFNSAGLGVRANDDCPTAPSFRSCLPAGFMLAEGLYYLVITGFDYDPVSAGGLIFPTVPFTGIFTATGPGGGSPIIGYSGASGTGTYSISLTGASYAVIPEPTTMLLFGTGLAGALAARRRKKA